MESYSITHTFSLFIEFCQRSQKEAILVKLIKSFLQKKKENIEKDDSSTNKRKEMKRNWLAWCLISSTGNNK